MKFKTVNCKVTRNKETGKKEVDMGKLVYGDVNKRIKKGLKRHVKGFKNELLQY